VQFYLTLLDTYVPDEKERTAAFAAVGNIPSIARKAEFCFKWIDSVFELRELRTADDRRALARHRTRTQPFFAAMIVHSAVVVLSAAAMYGSLVFRSRPWPAEAQRARRLARIVAINQIAGMVVVTPIIIYALGFSGSQRNVTVAYVTASILVVFDVGVCWLLYHIRKTQAIKNVRLRNNAA
jgi:hypothetical protein